MVNDAFATFCKLFEPLEKPEHLPELVDKRTGAKYCECHLQAEKLVESATTDAPLDQDEPDYRANREIVTDAAAFSVMKADALKGRSFSNIVAEFVLDGSDRPLKIIGGQHRIVALTEAYDMNKVNEIHGVKVYFDLTTEQRLDVQLISNTNIATSTDLIERMQETAMGPQLRDWSQAVGLLPHGEDFADKYYRGGPLSVMMARTFIMNFFAGKNVDPARFDLTETTPHFATTASWEPIRNKDGLWEEPALKEAAVQFAALVKAQRAAFVGKKPKPKPDFPEKALNAAILAAWAFVAGVLQSNPVRLARHYELAQTAGKDPLQAANLASGKHKSDPDNYRGLGARTDAKERGRLVEVFYLQAENGLGLTFATIQAGIAQYHAKQAALEAQKAREKALNG